MKTLKQSLFFIPNSFPNNVFAKVGVQTGEQYPFFYNDILFSVSELKVGSLSTITV